MKPLAFRKPFAEAVVAGLKTVDFRGLSTRPRGPLAIHASATYGPAERAVFAELRRRRLRLPEPAPERRGGRRPRARRPRRRRPPPRARPRRRARRAPAGAGARARPARPWRSLASPC